MGDLVLVTGVSGYLGAWVCRKFLDHGYSVRGTVRNVNKVNGLEHLTRWIEEGDKLELFQVDLLDGPEAWEAACKDCKFVAHTASPFFVGASEAEAEEKLYKPARDGTLNVLNAAFNAGTVKRVVLTSSITTMIKGHYNIPRPLTDPESWYLNLDNADPYCRSKFFAEQAAFDFVVEKNKAGFPCFDLCTLNPTMLIGPPLNSGWATSHQIARHILFGELPALPKAYMGIVDVRTVAEAHVVAIETPEAGGERFCCQGKSISYMDWSQTLGEEFRPLGYTYIKFSLPTCITKMASYLMSDLKAIREDLGKGPMEVDCSKFSSTLELEFSDHKQLLLDHAHGCIRMGIPGFKMTPAYEKYLKDTKVTPYIPL